MRGLSLVRRHLPVHVTLMKEAGVSPASLFTPFPLKNTLHFLHLQASLLTPLPLRALNNPSPPPGLRTPERFTGAAFGAI